MCLSPPRVIGSPLLKQVMKGFFHFSRTCQAALLASLSGVSGSVGTSFGNALAPALNSADGNGAS